MAPEREGSPRSRDRSDPSVSCLGEDDRHRRSQDRLPVKKRKRDRCSSSSTSSSSDGSCITSDSAPDSSKRLCVDDVEAILHLEAKQTLRWGGSSCFDTVSRGGIVLGFLQGLRSETIFLATAYLDTIILVMKGTLKEDHVGSLAVACLALAVKYEENKADFTPIPQLSKHFHYKVTEVLSAERFVLEAIRYKCEVPTTMTFLRYYLEGVKASASIAKMAEFFACLSLLQYDLLKFRPAVVAASSITMAFRLEGLQVNVRELLKENTGTQFAGKASECCIKEMHRLYKCVLEDNPSAELIAKTLNSRCNIKRSAD